MYSCGKKYLNVLFVEICLGKIIFCVKNKTKIKKYFSQNNCFVTGETGQKNIKTVFFQSSNIAKKTSSYSLLSNTTQIFEEFGSKLCL